jgi:proteasome lid subunit RPN8/RPN11
LLILQLKQQHVDFLTQETEKVYPVEACALLFGICSQNTIILQEIVIASNRLQSAVKFEIDPTTVVVALTKAEEAGLDLIGLFHSHPAPAVPSSTDLKFMKLWGDILWLIMSSTEGKLAAYQLENDILKEVSIKIG